MTTPLMPDPASLPAPPGLEFSSSLPPDLLAGLVSLLSLWLLRRWLGPEVNHWLEAPAQPWPRPGWGPWAIGLVICLAFNHLLLAQTPGLGQDWVHAALVGFWSAALVLAALIDLQTRLLPDRLTGLVAALALVLAAADRGWVSPAAALAGGLMGWSLPWLVNRWHRIRLQASTSPTEAIGRGDLCLLAALGLWVGPIGLAAVLGTASLLALVQVGLLGLVQWALRGGVGGSPAPTSGPVALGPWIALGALLVSLPKVADLLGAGLLMANSGL